MTYRQPHRILVVGGGRAGVSAVEELRRQSYRGEIAVLYDEKHRPYDRPGCAKGMLTGHQRPKDLQMPIAPGLDVDWYLGRRAVYLDREARTVMTDTDEVFEFDGLVVATGAAPVAPPGLPLGEPGIHLLYGLDDAWSLRSALHRARRVAVVGAGLTGSEVAYAVRTMARDCVLIDSQPYPMIRPLGEHAARLVAPEMRRSGVRIKSGRRLSSVQRSRRGWTLTLDNGEELNADVIVASTGERPDTGWLADSGFDTSDGVLCDQRLRVLGSAGAPEEGIVAAGTVARWPNLEYSADPMRIGQWIAALEQGREAARTLLGGEALHEPVTHQPRFWSDQFGLRIQVCGTLPAEAEVAIAEMRPGRRDVARAGVLLSYQLDDRLVGLVGINAPHAFTSMARAMIATQGAVAAPATRQAGNRRYLAAVG